jgi:hypothetical protein
MTPVGASATAKRRRTRFLIGDGFCAKCELCGDETLSDTDGPSPF